MARRSHDCSYSASVDLFEVELITNVAAANNNVQTSLKIFPNIVLSDILGDASVEIPHSSFVSTFGRHCWQNE